LETLLRQQTYVREITMHESTDSTLVGGFVARTADAEIDASVRTKIRALAALA
jgi:F0F1-type ATP synthase delta subunit